MEKTQETNTQALGLYVHVPFCSTTCDFCAFYQERPSKKGFEDYFLLWSVIFSSIRRIGNFRLYLWVEVLQVSFGRTN